MAFNHYPSQIFDSWSTGVLNLPRWADTNSTYRFQDLDIPTLINPVSGLANLATGAFLPATWNLTSYTPSTTGNVFQKVLGVFATEIQYLYPSIRNAYLLLNGGFDTSELDSAWYLSTAINPTTFQINTAAGYVDINKTQSDYSLFNIPERQYKYLDGDILITGIDLQQADTLSIDDFKYIADIGKTSTNSLKYWYHPYACKWIPLTPEFIRSDGYLDLNSTSNIPLRFRNNDSTYSLSTLGVKIDGVNQTATRVNLWTSVDERGLMYNISRLETENSTNFGNKLLALAGYERDNSVHNLTNAIGVITDNYEILSISPSSTGITNTNYTQFSIFDTFQTKSILEQSLEVSGSCCLSHYTLPETGTAIINDNFITVAYNVSGVVTFDNYTPLDQDTIDIYWTEDIWNTSTGQLTVKPYRVNTTDSTNVLAVRNVEIENNIEADRFKTFYSNPLTKWSLNSEEIVFEEISTFD